jgi:uncharacterized protein
MMNAVSSMEAARRKIAVIGSGISGMAAAWYLSKDPSCEVHVFEAAPRLGGHTATVDVDVDGEKLAIDTGFIVFNDRTYPNFIALLDELGVASQPTDMSFSVSDAASGIEYAGSNLNALFAQRRNLCSLRFLRMVRDIGRFNGQVEADLLREPTLSTTTLGDYLRRFGYSHEFSQWYLLPMGAAIWSSNQHTMEAFPLGFFVRFFRNHGLLALRNRPQWRVIKGGSRTYIPALTAPYRERVYLDTPVTGVTRKVWVRGRQQVCVSSKRGQEFFDDVVFACHSDQALRLLADPHPAECEILGAIPYTRNEVVLHHDASLLPHSRRAWSSWNVSLGRSEHSLPALTYNMNILQGLDSSKTWCVTLNQSSMIDPSAIVGVYHYEHPLFTLEGIAAQQRHAEINGHNNTWYCGAWWRNGFHEDGVVSALRIANSLLAQSTPALAMAG